MKIIEWHEKFSVGIKEIDDQHKDLIEILDALYYAMLKAKGSELVETTLEKVLQYTKTHFATEELLFKKYSYPEEKAHKAEHDAMLKKVMAFQRDFTNGELIGVDLMQFLNSWFVEHLQTTDYRYVEFFKKKGISTLP
ncbi:bacteriohemerythrin [Thiovibrio frasassiensis]|jgi:hemerythrin|uniref:Bacteriohemerythrin n=1 Tax=Thiovibrio frasassiensis TaxID=2984131 RepID=A0A9X4MJ33_9BACT|nr:bacteriohemerythrin [Thiovibrio frasassiensis]MDG4475774.1 bacteriohemerythrin [Thiovibrio frasassiensis]